jgi:hypothetical protein
MTRDLKKVEDELIERLGLSRPVIRRMAKNMDKNQARVFYKYYEPLKERNTYLASRIIFINEMIFDSNPTRLGVLANLLSEKGFPPDYSDKELYDAISYLNYSPRDYDEIMVLYQTTRKHSDYKI